MNRPAAITLLCALAYPLAAQRPMGSVKTEGAEVGGLVTVSKGRAVLGNQAAVVAGTAPADVTLERGGLLRVCAGSSVHLSQTAIAVAQPPLLLALDRGAMEIRTGAGKTDSIMTPDLRFELSGAAPLDLRIRVVPNGDTCVENAGRDAPVLHVTETFGDSTYLVRPGQRVLFEHGSLREVVDREASGCGCPKPDALVLAGKGKRGDGKIPEVARANPFPEAVSQGLQQPDAPRPLPVGEERTQVSTTLRYDGTSNTVSGPPGQATTAADVAAAAPSQTGTAGPQATNISVETTARPEGPHPLRAIGRFFRKIFGVH